MITLTLIDGPPVLVNPDKITFVTKRHDHSLVHFGEASGSSLMVRETLVEITRIIQESEY